MARAESANGRGENALRHRLPAQYIEEHRLLPLSVEEGRTVVGHVGRPEPQVLAELRAALGGELVLREMTEDAFFAAVRRERDGGQTAEDLIAGLGGAAAAAAVDGGGDGDGGSSLAHDLERLANEPPVVRLVNLLLAEAVDAGASDVHLEADGRGLRVRYRVDGMLHDAAAPPAHMRAAVVSRLKIMAELDIAERRLPQDGRVRLRIGGRETDVRVSTLPTLHGESVVLRLLDTGGRRIDFDALGLADDVQAALLDFARRPRGVMLATGPTGSGKSTTLYALLERVRDGREKMVSVEDPVEYEVPGIAQVPVDTAAGLTFARALRSILRQDPDVILVGEMRDGETAEICVQAALTGHLVFSTLHTNDAPSALTRLLDLGVADYLVASTVEVVLAQRLVRTICGRCAERVSPDTATRRALAEDGVTLDVVWRGRGCEHCRQTGFRGRTGVYEILVVDDAVRHEILRRRGASGIRRLALEAGMRPLRVDGWRHVRAGVTTADEVMRVTREG